MTMIARRVQIANRMIGLLTIILPADFSMKLAPVVFCARIANCSHCGKRLIRLKRIFFRLSRFAVFNQVAISSFADPEKLP